MKRQVAQVWIVLSAFLSFSICLPLAHVCLDRALDGQQAAGLAARSALAWISHTQGLVLQARTLDERHGDDVCQACLLAQNLSLNHAAMGLAVLPAVAPAPDSVRAFIAAIADSFRSAPKRAPPASR